MKPVGSLLSSLFRNLGIEDKIRLNSMQKEWHNLFNEPLSLHTYPVNIKNESLTINVDSPVWLGQLKFFRQDIIKKLHEYNIQEVSFRHGRVYQKKGQGARDKRQEDSKQNHKPITDSDIAWIDQTVSIISDYELKENIKKTIEKAINR